MKARVFEVGPRDGLQNESQPVTTAAKIAWVQDLVKAGMRDFELGSFVRPDKVPQMADTDALYRAVTARKLKLGKATPYALVPNLRGLERATALGVKHIAVFTAATEGFNRRNIGMSVKESLQVIEEVVTEARRQRIRVRGYVSTAFGCPFEGRVVPKQALKVIEKLGDMDVEEVSIGDTIGVATPARVDAVVRPAMGLLGADRVAVHFHDTRGTALANALRSLEIGVHTFDASAGGLGGCPFAPGATGNLATEDLVYLLEGLGVRTGINLPALARADLQFLRKARIPITSRYLKAFAANGGRSRAE
jgi:hydroxymethylglutaryl-CoA lyase